MTLSKLGKAVSLLGWCVSHYIYNGKKDPDKAIKFALWQHGDIRWGQELSNARKFKKASKGKRTKNKKST